VTAQASLPVVAIIGRPNVGKSALFNRLVSRRHAIVEDHPGVTRDRLYAVTEWSGRRFTVVDTGGLRSVTAEGLETRVRAQSDAAIEEADLVLFVVDVQDGILPEDRDIAGIVRRARSPVLVIANKVDGPAQEIAAQEFFELGLGAPFPVSAIHGRGIGDLLDAVLALLPAEAPPAETGDAVGEPIAVAIVGRPNVGKSSLVNAMLGEERVVVDATPGTTRDSVDTPCERGGRNYVLVDTAGLRRRARVAAAVEAYSASRARDSIARADVAVLVLDGSEPVSDQDQRIGRAIADAGRGVLVVMNKWDRIAPSPAPDRPREQAVRRALRFLDYAPILAVSATEGWGIAEVFDAIARVAESHRGRIATGPLNRVIGNAMAQREPPAGTSGRRLKVFYATQPATRPPTVVLFVNDPARMTQAYLRYLERAVRAAFDLTGTPLRLVMRRRSGEERPA